jgi:hypothetical protein
MGIVPIAFFETASDDYHPKLHRRLLLRQTMKRAQPPD